MKEFLTDISVKGTIIFNNSIYGTAMYRSLACVLLLAIFVNTLHATNIIEHKNFALTKETIKLNIYKIEDKGDKSIVQIRLSQIKNNKAITLNDLKEVHTAKIHLLIIDDTLEDYSHIHPKALKQPGSYEFEWEPKKQGNYRIWADIVMGSLNITDAEGKPVKDLEPIMGAFAHIVGFFDDWKNIVHIHPMGKEPSNLKDRGGPKLKFHIEPKQSGFIKLFAQVCIKGKEIFVPFGLTVKETT